ncbi:hypothetical protein EEL40_07310 [Muribaculaceae bacterium Isolate-083 (Janvier)]|jgi:hypothetical protein|uniref:hypothetical protein n=1 Tax=Bacteroides acidifaciens TaxID=85831 RepID=UPI000F475EE7|nr:hypothetical protein [Bacteroides acidifaciens]ROS97274.1 hypothetical protein EEL40_07310 [Muribaculaceae bacterium Isolate-083 (Janvier)]ROS99013.1 hypothetical protein EEL37_03635 [Muribaculaceae bacterium Isolate-077 (Janvier)]ROT01787.1 hypothetical protein EEL41_04135 [Muribaculaceae bacterium Isolate-084 (Janvier)]
MDNFSEFIKSVRLSCDKESPIRKFADFISTADTLTKVSSLNALRDKLQSDYRWLIYIKQLYPTIDVSGNLRIKQEQLNYCEQAINQLGNDVITDESQVSAADMERKRLEEERRKLNRF